MNREEAGLRSKLHVRSLSCPKEKIVGRYCLSWISSTSNSYISQIADEEANLQKKEYFETANITSKKTLINVRPSNAVKVRVHKKTATGKNVVNIIYSDRDI